MGINGAGIVADMLKKVGKNLKQLTLGFVENYIGDEGLKNLAETIANDLPALEELSVDLAFNDAKGYGGIAAIKSFAQKKYKNLDLRLSHNEFRDEDVKLMVPHIRQLVRNYESQ